MKYVAIALFGGGQKYGQYLGAFVRAHLNLFPIDEGWRLWIMHDDQIDSRYQFFLDNLRKAGLVQAIGKERSPLTRAMLWRMLPVFTHDPNWEQDYVFCRDLDACPMPRDRAACEAFIRSGCVVHTIHDAEAHTGIMGGLCGFQSDQFRTATGLYSLEDLCAAACKSDEQWAIHGTDQIALNALLLRPDGPRLCEHRFAGWKSGPNKLPARPPGVYPCGGRSALMPDEGMSRLSKELTEQADLLAAHLGAAGYDHEVATKFWDKHGDMRIAVQVAECER